MYCSDRDAKVDVSVHTRLDKIGMTTLQVACIEDIMRERRL